MCVFDAPAASAADLARGSPPVASPLGWRPAPQTPRRQIQRGGANRERAANVSDREREKDEPAPSKWHRLKASLFGRKPDAPIGELTPASETKADELRPSALPMAKTEAEPMTLPGPLMPEAKAPPVTEPKAEPEAAKDTPAAAVIPSPPSGLPAEKAAGGGKKKSKSGSQKRQRDRKIFVVVDEAERKAICDRAQAAGLSTSAYGRACMLGTTKARERNAWRRSIRL